MSLRGLTAYVIASEAKQSAKRREAVKDSRGDPEIAASPAAPRNDKIKKVARNDTK